MFSHGKIPYKKLVVFRRKCHKTRIQQCRIKNLTWGNTPGPYLYMWRGGDAGMRQGLPDRVGEGAVGQGLEKGRGEEGKGGGKGRFI